MIVEVTPGLTEANLATIEALDKEHEQLLSYGFDECTLGIPTVEYHGTRVDLCVDLAAEPGLPFMKPIDANNDKLVIGTLSAISFDVDINDGGSPDLTIHNKYAKFFGHIALDQEIKDDMTKLAELGNELALQGFGYQNEREWIQPLTAFGRTLEDTVKISSRNGARYNRLQREFKAHSVECGTFWGQRGWRYLTSTLTKERVSLHRWIDYNPEEDSLDNRLLVIDCDQDLQVSGEVVWDTMTKPMQINLTDVLTLDELAQLQTDTQFEFSSGLLSEEYKALRKDYSA